MLPPPAIDDGRNVQVLGSVAPALGDGLAGAGGRVGEDVHGDSADEIWEAIFDEEEMNYMACMPRSDIDAIASFLRSSSSSDDDDDDRDESDSGGGSMGLPFLLLLAFAGWLARRQLKPE